MSSIVFIFLLCNVSFVLRFLRVKCDVVAATGRIYIKLDSISVILVLFIYYYSFFFFY